MSHLVRRTPIRNISILLTFFLLLFAACTSEDTGIPIYTHGEGVPAGSSAITRWVDTLGPEGYQPGTDPAIDAGFSNYREAFGAASSSTTDVVCLGRGGRITFDLGTAIADGTGADLAIYENGIAGVDTLFAELAVVSVSSDGISWVRFPTATQNDQTVAAYAQIDPVLYRGFAGLHPAGTGTAFDLAELAETTEVTEGAVTLDSIRYIRVTDVVGDGASLADDGNAIYDPYPTTGSPGFDLDAVAILR